METTMREIVSQLVSECRCLADLCKTLSADQWSQSTDFYGWTPWDEIAHLAYFDETALLAATNPESFLTSRKTLREERARGEEISSLARKRFFQMESDALLNFWRERFEELCSTLQALNPSTRLPWYGPDMSARSFATARLMETWAHGQDIRDMLGKSDWTSPGLQLIAHLGVSTYGWSFKNRGLSTPEPVPYVELDAPDGTRWAWGSPSSIDYVIGPAYDFALLVTQRRHRSDTRLQWSGASAQHWTLIAQCFAGGPADGPAPGTRRFHT